MPEATTPAERAAAFDDFFAAHAGSQRVADLMSRVLGTPPELALTSFVTLEVLATAAAELRLPAGGALVDLACGRGGPGLWIARETGARLAGVDFSPVAIADATARAAVFGQADRATYRVGDLSATGLPSGCADGVLCVDSFNLVTDYAAAAREVHRLLRPGGRYVLTTWEPRHAGDPAIRVGFRDLNVAAVLAGAGLRVLRRDERPDLTDLQSRVYQDAVAAGDPGDDKALRMLQDGADAQSTATTRLRRLYITAERPA